MGNTQNWLPYPLQEAIRSLGEEEGVFLVGGGVRDAILGNPGRDYDFVLPGEVRQISRKIANFLGGDFYPLDETREMMRVLWYPDARNVVTLDFCGLHGTTIEADLAARDFTINAMAVQLTGTQPIIDPLGGVKDLKERTLRKCREGSLTDDPIRAVRAIRLAVQFGLRIEKETGREIRAAGETLGRISAERIRDELFRLLGGKGVAKAIRLLQHFSLLAAILPEIPGSKGTRSEGNDPSDVLEQTLASVDRLEQVLSLFVEKSAHVEISDLTSAQLVTSLGGFQTQICDHLAERIIEERTRRALLFFSALHLDPGEGGSSAGGKNPGSLHGSRETESADLAAERAKALACSNQEAAIVERVIRNHKKPDLIQESGVSATPRDAYRFFRDCGQEGVEVCLQSLAEMLGKRAGPPDPKAWHVLLEVNTFLLDTWFHHREENVYPPRVVGGDELIAELGLSPGPELGKLLSTLEEAQAVGQVRSREDAIKFSRDWINQNAEDSEDDVRHDPDGV